MATHDCPRGGHAAASSCSSSPEHHTDSHLVQGDCMAPHEAPVPFGGVWEVLVELVPDASEEEGAVGV